MDSTHSERFWHRVVVDDAGSWEDWLCDPKAKLSHGCRVVVRMQGDFMLAGTIANKRPVDFRRAVIAFRDVDGNERRTRIFGRRDADTQGSWGLHSSGRLAPPRTRRQVGNADSI
jgi:hypothetical protein